ncbi:MAG: signal transduction protein [Caulobacterales bacterium 32-69-10]|nr:MAG: signal transduction protein [Caulobacterales bacterium 32-69-10]
MKVSEAMTAQVVTANPGDSIQSVAKIMAEVDTGAVPVFEGGKVVGLVTDRDIVLRVVAEGGDIKGPVSAVMSDHVLGCHPDDSVADAAGKMASHQLRRLIVTDEKGALVGILSLGDIATDFGNKKVGEVLEDISADSH